MGDIAPLAMADGTQIDPVSGTGGEGTEAAPVGNPEYVCDDGSVPSSGLCADGTSATFYYIDPSGNWCTQLVSGYCPAASVAAADTTSTLSSNTVLLIAAAIGAWVYFGGKL
jgi:hypothetical protein